MSTRGVDGASLAIDVLRLVLPARRKEWGEAARSELAALTTPTERRRFALSCLRMMVADRATLRNVCAAVLVTALLLAAAVSTADISNVVARVVGIFLIAAQSWLLLAARTRPGSGRLNRWISPVGAGRAHGAVRVGACLGSSALMFTLVVGSRTTPGLGPGTGTGSETKPAALAVVGLIALAMTASLLAVTAERAAIPPRVVGVGGACGAIAGLVWYGFVLTRGYVDRGALAQASLIAVGVCAAVAMIAAGWRRPAARRVEAGLVAAVVASLLIFTLPMATYALVPSTVPDPSPGSHWPQLNQYAHDEQDAVEAIEVYLASILAGGMLSLVLLGSVGAHRRRSEPDSTPELPSDEETEVRLLR
ncbi:hypothetical protein ACPPVS_16560 [Cellulomonas sp. McL0617]|uniref:hypothetical protein n=1 Tax=Cellulomonas sp. McL0617 TaxID=3415675 RepID=UPI003CE98E3D